MMIEDKKEIEKLLLEYLKIIISEYGNHIDGDIVHYLLTNNVVEFSENNTVSFLVYKNVLYLPKQVYAIMPSIESNIGYGSNRGHRRQPEEYLDTNTTYYDYINHFILAGLTPLEYFKESLLHEAMHLCGCRGGNPLEEGITELKTRELAQKYGIVISGYGYPKEVEVAKRVQSIIGKDVIEELMFLPYDRKRSFLIEKVGIEKADLYFTVSKDMQRLSASYFEQVKSASDPYQKAELYSNINYSTILAYLDEYENKLL